MVVEEEAKDRVGRVGRTKVWNVTGDAQQNKCKESLRHPGGLR
jgi:hypothetical protein